jgi:hypothetical protein
MESVEILSEAHGARYPSAERGAAKLEAMSRRISTALIAGVLLLGATPTLAASANTKIRSFDFFNEPWDLGDGVTANMKGGEWESGSTDKGDFQSFQIWDVDHGDIDGDGVEEAIVSTNENTGGTGQFSGAVVFRWTAKGPVRVTSHGVGDRGDGGLANVVIVGGVARIDRYTKSEGACCPTEMTTFSVKLKGNKLVDAKPPKARAYIVFGSADSGPTVIKFARGTSSAAYAGAPDESALFDAAKGQTVTLSALRQRRGVGTSSVRILLGTKVIGNVAAGAVGTFRLPSSGRYTVTVLPGATSNSYASGELTIK